MDQAERRLAEHPVPRPRDSDTGERPRRRDVRPQLLRARRLLAAARRHRRHAEERVRVIPGTQDTLVYPEAPAGLHRNEGCTGSQGDDFFAAPNPPFGAVFTYYLSKPLQSSKDARRKKEKEREAENESVEFPTWDRIISESREDEPAIVFTVRDAAGNVVRHVEAPAKSGFHRVAWDLRYPPVNAWVPEEERGDDFPPSSGVLVAPGQFTVSMFKRIDGDQTDLGQSQSFDVVSIREPTLPGSSQEQRVVFDNQVHELARATEGTIKTIDAICRRTQGCQGVVVVFDSRSIVVRNRELDSATRSNRT